MGNYCNVDTLLFAENQDSSTQNTNNNRGKVNGALITDSLTGKSFKVRAKSVLLCAGPFTDALRRQADPSCQEAVTGSGGGATERGGEVQTGRQTAREAGREARSG